MFWSRWGDGWRIYAVINMCCKLKSLVNMTKPKLPIKLGVEQSIAGEKDVNRLSCVRPELGEFATLFITVKVWHSAIIKYKKKDKKYERTSTSFQMPV